VPKIRQAAASGTPQAVSYPDGRRIDLTWMYPPLERGVAVDWTGCQVAQFERSTGIGAPWQCTRAFDMGDRDEVADLLALWLYDGCLGWVAMHVSSPECTDVPRYLVRVNNRGASRGARPQLRHVRWIEVDDDGPESEYVSEDAQGAERAGWAAIRSE